MFKLIWALLAIAHISASCGNDAPSYELASYELARVPSTEGILYLSPDSHELITGGIATYRIYKTGVIFYSGDISYFGSLGTASEVQIPFSGRMQFSPDAVASAFYRQKDASKTIDKISVNVDSTNEDDMTSHVFAEVTNPISSPSSDASGIIELSTEKDIIKIKSADITGTIFEGTVSEIRLRLLLSEEKNF